MAGHWLSFDVYVNHQDRLADCRETSVYFWYTKSSPPCTYCKKCKDTIFEWKVVLAILCWGRLWVWGEKKVWPREPLEQLKRNLGKRNGMIQGYVCRTWTHFVQNWLVFEKPAWHEIILDHPVRHKTVPCRSKPQRAPKLYRMQVLMSFPRSFRLLVCWPDKANLRPAVPTSNKWR